MKLTASKTAINLIAAYCNKHGIACEQQDKTISFVKVTPISIQQSIKYGVGSGVSGFVGHPIYGKKEQSQ